MLADYLTKLSPESAVSVLGWEDLKKTPEELGSLLPFGEGAILADVLNERYDWKGRIKPDDGVEVFRLDSNPVVRLDSNPVVVYRDLEERNLFETDPLKGDAHDEHAFRANR